MARADGKPEPQSGEAVAAYKRLLAAVIDLRPSGTRQRLATALGKNRSFISQITNPAYLTPIPAKHLDKLFEICHFSPDEKRRFIDAYTHAHPNRPALVHDSHRIRPHTIYLPDLGDHDRNARLEHAVDAVVRQIVDVIDTESPKRKRP